MALEFKKLVNALQTSEVAYTTDILVDLIQ